MSSAPVPRRRRLARALAAALLAIGAVGACSDSTGPSAPFDGQWISTGISDVTPTLATITLSLDQVGSDVTGTGTMSYPPPGFASSLTVTGSASGNVVMLTLTSPALAGQAMTMQATLADGGDRFTGPLTLGQSPETTQFRTFER